MLSSEYSTSLQILLILPWQNSHSNLGSIPIFIATVISLDRDLFLKYYNNLLTVLKASMLISQPYFTYIAVLDLRWWAKKKNSCPSSMVELSTMCEAKGSTFQHHTNKQNIYLKI